MPMPLVAPLFLEGEHFTSTLTLVNEMAKSTSAKVTLVDSGGREIGSTTVRFDAHCQRQVRLSDVLKLPL